MIVDIRPAAQRAEEGELPGALVIERNVLEWRLDPSGADRIEEVRGHDQPVVVVCSEGYASSLAAASLAEMGLLRVADLVGGYRAWRAWNRSVPRAERNAEAPAGLASGRGPASAVRTTTPGRPPPAGGIRRSAR